MNQQNPFGGLFKEYDIKKEKSRIYPIFKKEKTAQNRQQVQHLFNLSLHESAYYLLTKKQKIVLLVVSILTILSLILFFHPTLIFLMAILTTIYFMDLIFNSILIFRSFRKPPEIKVKKEDVENINESLLPVYSVFCPLYKEGNVLPQFINAMKRIDYPKDKLEILLLLEEDDKDTIQKAKDLNLPFYFKTIIIPDEHPKTKPKALNHGLYHAKGEFAVIYDAEDIPDPLQLKKAILAFQKADDNVACIQAKLNFYNPHQNILTRVFTAEYSLWFDLVLTGLQSLSAPIPLGGTSNHFKTSNLKILKGWDPFNVTEDCDLGIRLRKYGYKTAIFNSTTLEEANSNFLNWFRQRSRWIKGYMQTYIVHMRSPQELLSDWKNPHILTFQLVVGGKIASLFINPLMWIITLSYFLFRATLGPTIESLFPAPIFYMGFFSLLFGNFLYFYFYMVGCAKRRQWGIIQYVFIVPLYWIMMSVSSWIALYQLVFKTHYWEKTHHGLHLEKSKNMEGVNLAITNQYA